MLDTCKIYCGFTVIQMYSLLNDVLKTTSCIKQSSLYCYPLSFKDNKYVSETNHIDIILIIDKFLMFILIYKLPDKGTFFRN